MASKKKQIKHGSYASKRKGEGNRYQRMLEEAAKPPNKTEDDIDKIFDFSDDEEPDKKSYMD